MPYASCPFSVEGSTEGRPSYPIVPRVGTAFLLVFYVVVGGVFCVVAYLRTCLRLSQCGWFLFFFVYYIELCRTLFLYFQCFAPQRSNLGRL